MGGTRTLIKGGKVDHLRNAEPGYIVRKARYHPTTRVMVDLPGYTPRGLVKPWNVVGKHRVLCECSERERAPPKGIGGAAKGRRPADKRDCWPERPAPLRHRSEPLGLGFPGAEGAPSGEPPKSIGTT
ncbi:hypothetical protein D1914_24215 [Salmonella enterica]|nr:hypothetical protein [Salmonella enterica subsp. enterica serovar Poona]EAO9157823.1 hypothetical protein [Salmonella enterica]EBJ3540143.1 hypothetical protein [Salmonella enterica]EBL1739828.1 hypothetical protein [Salmonella enterica]EBU7357267.1 hypothetical protein [Salmonella enterica subsp. enterica serovar Poona]